MKVNDHLHAPADLLVGKEPYVLLDNRLGGPPGPVWTPWQK